MFNRCNSYWVTLAWSILPQQPLLAASLTRVSELRLQSLKVDSTELLPLWYNSLRISIRIDVYTRQPAGPTS